jgi:hypothetical protein
VLLGGGARLALLPPQGHTVRVAGITAPRDLFAAFYELLSRYLADVGQWISEGQGTPADRDRFRQTFASDKEALLTLTEQEARDGAKIVLWPEDGGRVVEEDQTAFLERAGALARSTGTYLFGHGTWPNRGTARRMSGSMPSVAPGRCMGAMPHTIPSRLRRCPSRTALRYWAAPDMGFDSREQRPGVWWVLAAAAESCWHPLASRHGAPKQASRPGDGMQTQRRFDLYAMRSWRCVAQPSSVQNIHYLHGWLTQSRRRKLKAWTPARSPGGPWCGA